MTYKRHLHLCVQMRKEEEEREEDEVGGGILEARVNCTKF